MRIDAYSAITGVYNNKGTFKANPVSKASAVDKLEISQFGKDYQIAKAALMQAPDVREDKIADIKAKMSAGTYNVSIYDVAEKMAASI